MTGQQFAKLIEYIDAVVEKQACEGRPYAGPRTEAKVEKLKLELHEILVRKDQQ